MMDGVPPGKTMALTLDYHGQVDVLRISAKVGLPFAQTEDPPSALQSVEAIWDTGASGSAVTRKVADALSLKPTGVTVMSTAAGTRHVSTYIVSLLLPNHVWFGYLPVTEADLHGIDMLIGMDVIQSGEFAVTSHDGATVCTYRVPSMERIDFVANPPPRSTPPPKPRPPSRNAPCPCGSGRKYKNRCGRK